MMQRKRRSASPNSRDLRPAVAAKMYCNTGNQIMNNFPSSLMEKLDSRGLLKQTESILETPNETMNYQPMPIDEQQVTHQSLPIGFQTNTTPLNMNAPDTMNTTVASSEFHFEPDPRQTMNTNNLFYVEL